jgi:hypothetical protein
MSNSPFQGRKGSITDISIRYYNSAGVLGAPVCVATPNDPVLNKGVSLAEVMTSSAQGQMVLADQFVSESKPSIKFSFPLFTPLTVGMREGMAPEEITTQTPTFIDWGPRLITQQLLPPAIAGQEGFGVIPSPAGAVGGTLTDNSVPAPLTMTGTYAANTPPTGVRTVAIGTNMALGFSADLVGKYVSMRIPNNLAGVVRLSEANPMERCEINICGQTRTQKRWHLQIPEALLNPAEGDIPLGSDQKIDIAYTIVTAGRCNPYLWEWLPQQRVCA